MVNLNNVAGVYGNKYDVNFLGQLFWFTLPDLKITIEELDELFENANIDKRYLPNAINARDAFRRSTKLIESKRIRLNDGTYINLLVREVTCDSGKVVRHVVRENVDSKNVRLDFKSIVLLQNEGEDIYRYDLESLYSEEETLIKNMLDDFKINRNKYTDVHIRSMIMAILFDLNPVVVRPSGGVYFIPVKFGAEITALQQLIIDLGGYCINEKNEKTSCFTVPIIDIAEQREMVKVSLQDQIKDSSNNLIKEIKEIIDKGRKVSEKTATSYVQQAQSLKNMVKEYEDILDMEITSVQAVMDLALEKALELIDKAL